MRFYKRVLTAFLGGLMTISCMTACAGGDSSSSSAPVQNDSTADSEATVTTVPEEEKPAETTTSFTFVSTIYGRFPNSRFRYKLKSGATSTCEIAPLTVS